MKPLLIFPGTSCYEAKEFHCTSNLDSHDLHCTQCHEYAETKMVQETVTVYRHPHP